MIHKMYFGKFHKTVILIRINQWLSMGSNVFVCVPDICTFISYLTRIRKILGKVVSQCVMGFIKQSDFAANPSRSGPSVTC